MKTTAINMKQFLPLKDDVILYDKNPSITGVFYDFENKVAVASDACILCVSAESYDPKFEQEGERGVSVNKEGQIVKEGVYPNYMKCFPKVTEEWITVKLDKKYIREAIRKAKEFIKQKELGRFSLEINVGGIWFNAKRLEKVMRVVDSVSINLNGRYPSAMYGKKGKTEVMLMPMYSGFSLISTPAAVVRYQDEVIWEDYKEEIA